METVFEIIDNKEYGKFEMVVEGKKAFVDYKTGQDKIFLTHTEVPRELEGRRLGSMLVRGVLENIAQTKYKIFPLCPFVAAYMKRHPEWNSYLAPGVNI
ncbi:GNAT family N-acetyltransferase [Xanthovirga aplysinae]|uniref:GNAT family N-acetyltransferase n=1 Tax=Xanthovirga aplysinae TaxID=2529853 RepID=UPI0012BC9E8F|nr:GNAT family N-acetyltransferase [Xanthovirga aplysinae]MTI29676.1 N-acetyltransferase [Xanthovirga aplysinae]